MRIVVSKDRPAQLDLLLRSLELNAPKERTKIVYLASTDDHEKGYRIVNRNRWILDRERAGYRFEDHVAYYLKLSEALPDESSLVTFLCDDDLAYRDVPVVDRLPSDVICYSLRLGDNTSHCYPPNIPQRVSGIRWDWRTGDGDFGYPGSIDGHVFRGSDLRQMLLGSGASFPNPTALELALVEGCAHLAERRPCMTRPLLSVLVGNPTNRVSEQSGVRFGNSYPTDPDELTARFLAGERINLDAACHFAAANVDGAHTEIPFEWERRPK